MHVRVAALVLLTASSPLRATADVQFPAPRVSTVLHHADWQASPIVAVGEVTNIARYGEQTVERLPPPTSPEVHKLYWCVADFHVVAILKGHLRDRDRKYLWATTFPTCELWPSDPKFIDSRSKTRAWFLREEGRYLRPTFDYGTYKFVGLLSKWNDEPLLPARERFGAMLLTPSANADNLEDYASYLWAVGDIACELLGQSECARRIRSFLLLDNVKLTDAACGFLKGQLREDCRSR